MYLTAFFGAKNASRLRMAGAAMRPIGGLRLLAAEAGVAHLAREYRITPTGPLPAPAARSAG